MYFAFSDVHGHSELMKNRIEQILPYLKEGDSRLIMLGDYIDRGRESFNCLKMAYDLQKEFGEEKVVVLKGNHEEWFREFLFEDEDLWLAEDKDFSTTRTFLTELQRKELKEIDIYNEKILFVKKCILENHKELLDWMKNLKAFYETESQIFVHAGVDEDIPKEEAAWCTWATPEYMLLGKYPPTTGRFYKDVIAGHVAASSVAGDCSFEGIYFDGKSHFYIDGSTTRTRRVLCLAYDEKKKQYYEFTENGEFKEIQRWKN